MASRVVLHIGMMKSGTTFIQQRLSANAAILDEQGIFFLRPWSRQVAAVADLAGRPRSEPGSWAALVAEVNAHPGVALVSMEFMVNVPEERIAGLLDDFAGAEVDCVVTVRDLGRSVPAMWQEALQNRSNFTWQHYLRAIEERTGPGQMFWRQQGADQIVGRWVRGLGASRVTVITVPPSGAPRELLWERFCEATGLSPASWVDGLRSNESLGAISALLMGRVNDYFADVDKEIYNRKVKTLGKFVLPERTAQEPRIGFVVPAWLHQESDTLIASIRAAGPRVIGDLEELRCLDVPGVDPGTVTDDQLLDVAVETLAKVLEEPAPKRARKARAAFREGT